MAQVAVNAGRRVMNPVWVLMIVLVGIAALALGFSVRAWTESSPKRPAPIVVSSRSENSPWQLPCRGPRVC